MVSEKESNQIANSKNGTVKFLCSYGGKILLRPTDGKIRYVGGLTRVLAVDRSISYAELMVRLVEFCGSSVVLRCQLPNGDLETLITIRSDEELAFIIEEYDRASSKLSHPLKIRAVLSPPKELKQISPPPSSAPSVADFSVYSLAYGFSGDRNSCRSCPPTVRSPVKGRYGAPGCSYCLRRFGREPREMCRGRHCNHRH